MRKVELSGICLGLFVILLIGAIVAFTWEETFIFIDRPMRFYPYQQYSLPLGILGFSFLFLAIAIYAMKKE